MGVLIRKKVNGVSERASEQTNERSGACEWSKQYETSSAERANEWVLQANKRTEEQMAQFSTHQFHSLSTHRAPPPQKDRNSPIFLKKKTRFDVFHFFVPLVLDPINFLMNPKCLVRNFGTTRFARPWFFFSIMISLRVFSLLFHIQVTTNFAIDIR